MNWLNQFELSWDDVSQLDLRQLNLSQFQMAQKAAKAIQFPQYNQINCRETKTQVVTLLFRE